LKPETTAGVMRAYIQDDMQSQPQPVYLYYVEPHFRYDRPQKGRYRHVDPHDVEIGISAAAQTTQTDLLQVITLILKECKLEIPIIRHYPQVKIDLLAEFNFDTQIETDHQDDKIYESHSLDAEVTNDASLESVLLQPKYIKSSVNQNSKSISLNPYDHYSIPLFGRETQITELNDFLDSNHSFLMKAVIGPSGSGKTRLASEWLHFHVDQDQWHSGILEGTDNSVWKTWTPHTNTLIVIDYLYRFHPVINTIIDQCTKKNGRFKVRLVILDHIFPDSLRDLPTDYFHKSLARDRRQVDERYEFFYPVLELNELHNRLEILGQIIGFVSKQDIESNTVKDAIQVLQNMGSESSSANSIIRNKSQTQFKNSKINSSAAHPLFAILIGKALKNNRPVNSWQRHDLIDYYLNTLNRLPWKKLNNSDDDDKLGVWVGAFVAVATIRRGITFNELFDCLPSSEKYSSEQQNKIIDWCNRIVASNSRNRLKQFEPDILGESFFLLFYKNFMRNEEVRTAFLDMINNIPDDTFRVERETTQQICQKFMEFIKRLARNLANDDQDSSYVEEAWNTLASFLNPSLFTDESPLKLVVSEAILEVTDILERIE